MNLKRIDNNSPVAIYAQIKAIVREQIETGKWKPGDKIPSEAYLSTHNKISAMTVRQAINDLCDEGFLYKVRGRGTFVSKTKVQRDLSELTSLSEGLKKSGYNIKWTVLNLNVITATNRVAKKLEISKGDQVLKIERLMTFEGEPFYYETNYLPYDLCDIPVDSVSFKSSIYQVLEQEFGVDVDHAILTLEAISCDSKHSKILGIKHGAAILNLSQITYSKEGRPIIYFESASRSDIYKYTLVRKRKK